MTIEIKQVDINLIACLDMLGWLFEDGRPNPDAAKIVATQREQFEARIAELELERAILRQEREDYRTERNAAEARLAEAVEVIRPFADMGRPVFLSDGTIVLRGTWSVQDVSIEMIHRAARFIQETERG